MSIGTLKAEQLSSKVILTCESCSYKTSQHRPSKARQKLAAHMTGHSNVQKEPTGPTDAQEGLDSEGGHSAPEAEGVDDNGEYSSQQMLTDGECNDQVPQQGGLNPSVVAHQVLSQPLQGKERIQTEVSKGQLQLAK